MKVYCVSYKKRRSERVHREWFAKLNEAREVAAVLEETLGAREVTGPTTHVTFGSSGLAAMLNEYGS